MVQTAAAPTLGSRPRLHARVLTDGRRIYWWVELLLIAAFAMGGYFFGVIAFHRAPPVAVRDEALLFRLVRAAFTRDSDFSASSSELWTSRLALSASATASSKVRTGPSAFNGNDGGWASTLAGLQTAHNRNM